MNPLWLILSLPLAQANADAPPVVEEQSMVGTFVMLGAMFVVFYFLLIRPQQQQENDRKTQIDALTKNDRVVTTGGILGVVTNVKDEEVTLRIDDDKNVKVKVLKTGIAQVLKETGEASADKS